MRSKSHHMKNDAGPENGPLSGIKKKNNFSVPDRYFEEFPHRLQSRLSVEEPITNILYLIFSPRLVWIYSFVFVIISASVLYFNYQVPDNSPVIVQAEDLGNIDEFLIAEELDEEFLHEEDLSLSSVEQAEMEDYLIDNHIDFSTIINDLN
jgi:hypothetical protein